MTIISSYDWASDTFTHHGDNLARTAWREAVAEIAERAKITLPDCIGRVDAAVKIVLAGDVELLEDGTAKVGSSSNGTMKYFIVNGECPCKDYGKAPSNWCKHRISAGLAKRAHALTKTKMEQQNNGVSNETHQTSETQVQPEPITLPVEAPVETEPVTPTVALPTQSEPVVSSVALPEAPASVNCHIMLEGRQVQVTLRGTDETLLLARLGTLLQQYPVAQPPIPPPTQGTAQPVPDENPYCDTHKVALKKFSKDGRAWYSHKTPNGSWCRGE